MGFGVKEPKIIFGEHVPGTSLLVDIGGRNVELADHSSLKHARGKNSDIILVPQPSDSPNDPLVSNTAHQVCRETQTNGAPLELATMEEEYDIFFYLLLSQHGRSSGTNSLSSHWSHRS
jgi:hypothetical protein